MRPFHFVASDSLQKHTQTLHIPAAAALTIFNIWTSDFGLLCLALLPFVLPAVVRSISPRKCISLRELQTTNRIPTVCSPSTSHFSRKNRCILSPLFPLSVAAWRNCSRVARRSTSLRPCSSSQVRTASVALVSLYVPGCGHPLPARLSARSLTEGLLLFSSFLHPESASQSQQDCGPAAPPPLPKNLSEVV